MRAVKVTRDVRTWIAVGFLLVSVARCAHAYAWTDDPLAAQWRYVGFAGLRYMMTINQNLPGTVTESLPPDPTRYVKPADLYHHIDPTNIDGYGILVGNDPSSDASCSYSYYPVPSGQGPWVKARGTGTLEQGEIGSQWIGMRSGDEWYVRYTFGEYWIKQAPDSTALTGIAETGARNTRGPAATQFYQEYEEALNLNPLRDVQGQRWGEMWVCHRVGGLYYWKYRAVVLPTRYLPDPWGLPTNYKIQKSLTGSSASTAPPCLDLGGVNPVYGWGPTGQEVFDDGWGAAYESWNTSICVEIWNSAEMPAIEPQGLGSLDPDSGWPSFLGDPVFGTIWKWLQPLSDWLTDLVQKAVDPIADLLWPLDLFDDTGA